MLRLKSDWHGLEIEAKTAKMRLLVPSDVAQFKAACELNNSADVLDFTPTLLEGLHLEDAPDFMVWLETEREAIRTAWLQTAVSFARHAEPDAALPALKKILQFDELCEEAVQLFLEHGEPSQNSL